jgi:hypothetical protein
MAEFDELRASMAALHEKVDRVLALLEAAQGHAPKRARSPKQKPSPLTEQEVSDLQAQFARLYDRWVAGHELEIQEKLDALDVDQLRRLADANNLNVTAKMPKEKVLYLLGARFREKKQLLRPMAPPSQHNA